MKTEQIILDLRKNYINNGNSLNTFNYNEYDYNTQNNLFINSVNYTQDFNFCIFINCRICQATASGQTWINDLLGGMSESDYVFASIYNINDGDGGVSVYHLNDCNLSDNTTLPNMWEHNKYLDIYGNTAQFAQGLE